MPSYLAGFTVSNHALITLADALRAHRRQLGIRWSRLTAGRQALLVVAHLRKGETCTDLAAGFGIGTTKVFRYIHEALEVLAAPGGCSGPHPRCPEPVTTWARPASTASSTPSPLPGCG